MVFFLSKMNTFVKRNLRMRIVSKSFLTLTFFQFVLTSNRLLSKSVYGKKRGCLLLRSFLAIELPSTILHRIGDVQKDLKASKADVRWVSPQNIHLTLKFFGNIEEQKIESIIKAIEEPARTTSPISVLVQGMGAFPGFKNPRVIWAGFNDGKEGLISFQKRLDEALQKIGFQPEGRTFHPHLTLGRLRSNRGKEELIRVMERYREEVFGSFQVETVVLFKSDLTPHGPIYTRLKGLRLMG